jgi:hypothetical protein
VRLCQTTNGWSKHFFFHIFFTFPGLISNAELEKNNFQVLPTLPDHHRLVKAPKNLNIFYPFFLLN